MSKHTSGEWALTEGFVRLEDQIAFLSSDIGSDREWEPVMIHDEEGEAAVVALCHPVNAPRIVRAVNNHEALLAACRDPLALLEDPDADAFQADTVTATLRAVIAKAGGGK